MSNCVDTRLHMMASSVSAGSVSSERSCRKGNDDQRRETEFENDASKAVSEPYKSYATSKEGS